MSGNIRMLNKRQYISIRDDQVVWNNYVYIHDGNLFIHLSDKFAIVKEVCNEESSSNKQNNYYRILIDRSMRMNDIVDMIKKEIAS